MLLGLVLMNRTGISTNRSDGSNSVSKCVLMYHINILEQEQKGMEIYEIWFAPDHKMPYCNNKGTLFIIAINSDSCYIKIIILIIMELMIIIIILNTNSNFSKCYMNCPQVAICTDFL